MILLPELTTCTACPLHERGFPVHGSGDHHARVMVIGEAPGEEEHEKGTPFVGRSGRELSRLLALGGVDRETAYVTNLVKHWPGEGNPTPGVRVIKACRPWVLKEIELVDPAVILAVGGLSAKALIPGVNLRKDHGVGRVMEICGKERVVVPLYHPAAGMHNPALRPIIQDGYERLKHGIARPPTTIHVHGEIAEFDLKRPLALDFETTSLDVDTCEVVTVAYSQVVGTGFAHRPSERFWRLLKVFIYYGGRVVVHNAAFDLVILERVIGVRVRNFWDTMLSGYVSGRSLGLKARALREHNVIMRTFAQVGEGEKDASKIPAERLYPYAAVDADQTLQFYYEDLLEVEERGIQGVIDTEFALMWVIEDMRRRGVVIDVDRLEELSKELEVEITEKKRRVYEILGREFNIDSGDQLADILFGEFSLKPFKRTKSKKRWAVDKEALKYLEALYPENKLLEAILDYRRIAKIKSTYVDGLRPHITNGRIHPRLKQVGASTFRFSAEDPNYQNQPSRDQRWKKAIKGLFKASPGHKLVAADYGQLEVRVAAAISQDQVMIGVFNTDGDIHTKTVREILKSEVDVAPNGMNLRTLAKIVNFGSLYGLSGGGLQRYLASTDPPIHISLQEAVEIVEGIRKTYPEYMAWVDHIKAFVRANGYAETMQGRRKYFPVGDDNSTEKEWVNMPVQGTAGGDVVRDAMVEFGRRGYPLIINVHDELVFDVPEELAEEVARDVDEIMVSRAEWVLGVKVKVEVSVGDTWGEMKKL